MRRLHRSPPKLAERGLIPAWRDDGGNRCPGCGGAHFYIGRTTAECAREGCSVALPLPETFSAPVTFINRGNGGGIVRRVLAAA